MHNLLNACSNNTTFKLQRTKIQNTRFPVYISDTHVTLKHSQGRQPKMAVIDPKQGYNQSKFERWCPRKRNVNFLLNEKVYQLSPLKMCENQKIVLPTIVQSFNLIG